MWVKFHSDMDWSPRPGVTIAYRAGWSGNVPTPVGEAAVKAGKAVRLRKARKDAVPIEREPVDASEVGV